LGLNTTAAECLRWGIAERISTEGFKISDGGENLKEVQFSSAIGFTDLSPELQEEVQNLQECMAVEL